MDYLNDFERHIALYDGMLIETGGSFGAGKLGGDQYVDKCLKVAENYLTDGGRKECLLDLIDRYISQYEDEINWKYLNMEMTFLNNLRDLIMQC